MKRGLKKRSYENLTQQNIQHVINLLNPTDSSKKAITKREACSILNISYNTTRLDKILQDFWEKKAYRARRIAHNRGKPPSQLEIQEIVGEYLTGENISSISKSTYRSPSFIKNILERIGVPQRPSQIEGRKQAYYLPEQCVAYDFEKGEVVWSATHHAPAEIIQKFTKEYQDSKPGLQFFDYHAVYGCDCYSIYVRQKASGEQDLYHLPEVGGFFATALTYDLGKLTHLQEYGVNLAKL